MKRDPVGLSVLLLIAVLSTAATPAALSAGLRPVPRAAASCSSTSPQVAARAAVDGSGRGLSASARSQLGKRGEVTGRLLTGRTANGASVSFGMPTESNVSEPVDDLVIYTTYTASVGSQVRALDLVTGCDALLASPSEIVRSASLDPTGRFLYVHSVKKSGRADAGVVRVDLASGQSAQIVEALRPNQRLGPIFGTELHWSADGSALAVQSCGMNECLTRTLDVTNGRVKTFDEPDQGAFVALSEEHLVTYAACHGLPCDLVSADLATGEVRVLATDTFEAIIASAPGGRVSIQIQSAAGSEEVIQ